MKVLRCWGQNKAPPLICVPRATICHIQQKAPIAPLGLAAFYTEDVSVAKAWVKEMLQCTVIPRLPKRWGFDPLAKEPQNDNQKSICKQLGGKVTCRNRRNKVYTTQFHKLLQMQNSEVLLTNRPSPRKITILDRNQFRHWLDAQPKANPNWFSSAQSFYFNFPLLKAQFKGRSCLRWILQPTATPRTAREFVPQQFVCLDTLFPQRGRGRCPIPSRVRPGGCHPVPPTGHNLPPHLGAKRFTTAPNSSLLQITENPIRANTLQDESFRISSFLPCCLNQLLFLPLSSTSLVMIQVHNKPRWCMNLSLSSSHPRLFPLGLACLSVTISPHPSACIPWDAALKMLLPTKRGVTEVLLHLCPLSST